MQPVVVAAHPMETEPLRSVCSDLQVEHFGVGAINSAYAMPNLRATLHGKDIIYVGSAGILGSFAEPILFRAARVSWQDLGQRQGKSYAIQDDLKPVDLSDCHLPFAENAPVCEVLCSASISLDPCLPEDRFTQPVLENVELFSVATALVPYVRTFTAVLATTNSLGQDAHEEWKQNVSTAAHLCKDFVISLLKEP